MFRWSALKINVACQALQIRLQDIKQRKTATSDEAKPEVSLIIFWEQIEEDSS